MVAVKDRMQRIVSDVIVRAGGAAVITEAVQVCVWQGIMCCI